MWEKASLIILCLCAYGPLSAVEISSKEPIEYSNDQGELIARGDAKIVAENFIIQADEIKFQKDKATALAGGNVRVDNGKFYALADSVFYDFQKHSVRAENSKVKIRDYFLYAENLNLSSDVQNGSDGTIFFGPPDRIFSPSMSAKSFKISQEKFLEVEEAKFKVGQASVFYWPRYSSKLSNQHFYLEPNFGTGRGKGAYLQNDFYFGIHNGLKIGGLLDAYTQRGILFGPAVKLDSGNRKLSLDAKFGFIHDNAPVERRGFDINGNQIRKDRYFGRFSYLQHPGNNIDLVAKTHLASDSEAERDFRRSWYDSDQRPDSFTEAVYRGQNCVISAFGQAEFNNFYESTQRLPEFRFDYLPTKLLGTAVIHNAHFGTVRIRGVDRNMGRKVGSYRSDVYYGAALPLSYKNFAVIKPVFGVSGLAYDHNVKGGTHGRVLVQGGVDMSFNFVGYSDYTNKALGIDGLKHTINPIIQYRVIPSGNISDRIPQLDVDVFSVELPIIDLGDMRNIDHLPRQNLLRLGIKNNFYTQSGSYIPRKLFKFDIFQDILFARNFDKFGSKQHRFQDTYFLAGIYPARWLSVDIFSRIYLPNPNLHELKAVLSIKDANFWQAAFTSHYSKWRDENLQQYALGFKINLSSRTSFFVEEKYDAKLRQFSEHKMGVSTILADSWLADIGIAIRKNTKREDKLQFNWHFRLLDF